MPDFESIESRLAFFLGKAPKIHESAWVHPSAVVMGDVELAARVSVWPMAVLRGDINSIRIGEGSNIQDGAVVHLADNFGVDIAEHCTVGHQATVHACTLEPGCLIGIHATILDGAVIGEGSLIGAHALVTGGTRIPPGSLVLGAPARVVRPLSPEEIQANFDLARKYVAVSRAQREGVGPR